MKKDLQDGVLGNSTVRHYMRIPLSSLHNGHQVGGTAGINQNVDRKIISKIFEVVGNGITNVGEVRRCVSDYVEKELFRGVPVQKGPRLSNRRYHSTKADLRNHISRAIAAQKYGKDGQESLRKEIEEWMRALQRWARKSKNGLNSLEQEELLSYLKRAANVSTRNAYDSAVAALKNLSLYKDKQNVKNYVDNVWLSCSFRWANCMRKRQVLNTVDTNNGTEAQNKTFKCQYLPLSQDKSVYGLSVMLVETYIPDCHQKYLQRNVQLSSAYRRLNTTVPSYLHDRPPHFIKHCLKAKFSSGDLRECDVLCVDM
ncbi:hypothetical protein AWC38_SpisGene23810, partial [Stylophora pistillata]